MQIPVEYILSCYGHVSTMLRGFTNETATRSCADHAGSFCAVYCNRGMNVISILSVEKVRRCVSKCLR